MKEQPYSANKSLDEILDLLSNDLDELGYLEEEIFQKRLNEIRSINQDCADELEKEIYVLIEKGLYGVGASYRTKTYVIRPIQRKYRK